MRRYSILGINDDESVCSICGKKDLKRVVWLEDTETGGDPFPVGTTCAAKLQKITVTEQKAAEKS